MTLLEVVRAIEAAARMQPSVAMVVPNDVFRLNATPDARYGVFAWTQRQHAGDVDGDFHRFAFSLFFVDRLTADKANELEIQSVGIQTLEAVLRELRDRQVFPLDGYTFDTFNQRFEDECAGVWCSVTFQVPVSPLCINEPPVPPVPPPILKTVADLISEGFAVVVTGTGGDYIEILPSCPYAFDDVTDLAEVATDARRLTQGKSNAVAWDRGLPSGWTEGQVAGIYAGASLPYTPRARMLWDVRDGVGRLEVTFRGSEWSVNDYPWGSGTADGVFAPRYNREQEGEYAARGWLRTPDMVVVNISGIYTGVAQTMFTRMTTTRRLAINCDGVFGVHDAVGMFEGCGSLRDLTITGAFRWDSWRLCHNAFKDCAFLVSVPFTAEWGRESEYNTIYPRFDGVRGSADAYGLFTGCSDLKTIGPRLNFNAISGGGCTADGISQAGLTGPVLECPVLTDVRIINLGNGSWDFSDPDGPVYAPSMDAESIAYILDHAKDESGHGYSVTFSSLHQSEVMGSAIAAAEAKGWTVIFSND